MEDNVMTVQERILALRLFEWQDKKPDYMKMLGVFINIEHKTDRHRNGEKNNV